MSYVNPTGSANYDSVEFQLVPNGEIVTSAMGQEVFICRPNGVNKILATLHGHFFSFPSGAHAPGSEFSYMGITFISKELSTSGQYLIKGSDGKKFDGRGYTVTAISTTPIAAGTISTLIAERMSEGEI